MIRLPRLGLPLSLGPVRTLVQPRKLEQHTTTKERSEQRQKHDHTPTFTLIQVPRQSSRGKFEYVLPIYPLGAWDRVNRDRKPIGEQGVEVVVCLIVEDVDRVGLFGWYTSSL